MDTMQMDCALIDAVITNYIKGGIEQLSVGNSHVGLTNITGRTVDHEFTVGDLY
ncbi:hypothetical protein SCARR_02041 [Pontiella sulfatireligans]|uniref:Uncharacterized protein n=2 Tax=Pontiella sulfatireligans TaxID=2750658 RepID=A0A6C2UKQ2_9BACT|nr:hypothetical protein SCARR_02041 [Pontiella sulfatireligans]